MRSTFFEPLAIRGPPVGAGEAAKGLKPWDWYYPTWWEFQSDLTGRV